MLDETSKTKVGSGEETEERCNFTDNKSVNNIFFPVGLQRIFEREILVLYGCKTWSLKLREESRLREFENRVLRGIFWPKRDEVTGEWRKLHNEELNDLYCSPNIVWVIKSAKMRWAGHVARMGKRRGV